MPLTHFSAENRQLAEKGTGGGEKGKIRTNCNMCTNCNISMNKVLQLKHNTAGYTKFFPFFLHNVQRKELAIIRILM